MLVNIFCFYVIFGYHFLTFGMYYVEWTQAFDTTKAKAGGVGAVMSATSCICGG